MSRAILPQGRLVPCDKLRAGPLVVIDHESAMVPALVLPRPYVPVSDMIAVLAFGSGSQEDLMVHLLLGHGPLLSTRCQRRHGGIVGIIIH
jgi:hypothetical protein